MLLVLLASGEFQFTLFFGKKVENWFFAFVYLYQKEILTCKTPLSKLYFNFLLIF